MATRAIPFTEGLDDRFERRESKSFGDRLGNLVSVAWDADVVSIDGAHYHFWIPNKLQQDKAQRKSFLLDCKSAATHQGDPVSFSYSYLPGRR